MNLNSFVKDFMLSQITFNQTRKLIVQYKKKILGERKEKKYLPFSEIHRTPNILNIELS